MTTEEGPARAHWIAKNMALSLQDLLSFFEDAAKNAELDRFFENAKNPDLDKPLCREHRKECIELLLEIDMEWLKQLYAMRSRIDKFKGAY